MHYFASIQRRIDLELPHDKQISALLETKTQYDALVRAGRFESMVRREDGKRLITREMFMQMQHFGER